jgi:hypothetical protein
VHRRDGTGQFPNRVAMKFEESAEVCHEGPALVIVS